MSRMRPGGKGRLLYPIMLTQILSKAEVPKRPLDVELDPPGKQFDVTAITPGHVDGATRFTME